MACPKAVGFYTQVGVSEYNYSAMSFDEADISDTSKVITLGYGSQPSDPGLVTLGATSLTLNFDVLDSIWVYLLFYP